MIRLDNFKTKVSRGYARYAAPLGLSGLLVCFAGLLMAAGCRHEPARVFANRAGPVFVSERECAPCHSGPSKSCAASNHALTLRAAGRAAMGALAPPAGQVPGPTYTVRDAGDHMRFATSAGSRAEKPCDLVFGAGKLGMTFVSLEPDNTLTELRMSWYPGRHTWYITPGQESLADNDPGEHNDIGSSRSCVGCHSVTVPGGSLLPDTEFFGVGCQSCHGPASLHVAAARAGKLTGTHIDGFRGATATRINEMCGKCHRRAAGVGTTGDEVTMTQRFQPYGLSQSPCFQKSGGKLSCITCHDPHANASTDQRTYERACLGCHGAAAKPGTASDRSRSSTRGYPVCPVNPHDKCIACHMPKRKVFPSSRIPISMADHLIWAYSRERHIH